MGGPAGANFEGYMPRIFARHEQQIEERGHDADDDGGDDRDADCFVAPMRRIAAHAETRFEAEQLAWFTSQAVSEKHRGVDREGRPGPSVRNPIGIARTLRIGLR